MLTLALVYLLVTVPPGTAPGQRMGLGYCLANTGGRLFTYADPPVPPITPLRWFLYPMSAWTPTWVGETKALPITLSTERCYWTPMSAVYQGGDRIEITRFTLPWMTGFCIPGGYTLPGNHGECPPLPWTPGAHSLHAVYSVTIATPTRVRIVPRS